MGMIKHSQRFKNLKKEIRDEVDFLHEDKHQNLLQVDFNTLGIKVSYKVILSLLMGMIKHSQSSQINRFALFLQYFKKEVWMEFVFACRKMEVSLSWHYCF